jgi:fluoride exporter
VSAMLVWLAVGVLGGLASTARIWIHAVLSAGAKERFPLGTLAVNLSGALLLGVVVGVGLRGDAYLLAATATLGSYTTFSTLMLESSRLADDDQRWLLVLNIGATLALGVVAVAVGRAIGGL